MTGRSNFLEALAALARRLPSDSESRDLLKVIERQSFAYEALLSSVPDFAYTFNLSGRFTYINQALLDLWGLTLEQAVGKNFFDLKYPDDLAARLQQQIQHVVETGHRVTDETPYTSPAGKSGFFEYIFSPVFGTGGEVLMVAGTTRDITERKRVGEQSRTILESITDGFLALDSSWRFTYANRKAGQILRRPSEELLGKNIWEEYPGLLGTDFEIVYRGAATDQGAGSLTAFYPEHRRWYEVHAYPSVDGISIYFRDATDRKLDEEALQKANLLLEDRVRERTAALTEAKAKFQAMYDQGLFAGFLDLQGTVVDANRTSLEQCGFVREDVIGKSFWECGWWNRSPEVAAWVRKGIAKAIRGEPFKGESIYFTADGGERVVNLALMPIKDEADHVQYLLATGMDVTEQRNAESDRRTSELLRDSEAKYRQLAETLPQMVWAAGPDGMVDYMNSWTLDYTGLPPAIGDWSTTVHPEDVANVHEQWAHSVATGMEFSLEQRIRRKADGIYRLHVSRARPIRDAQGGIIRWLGTNIDVHDQRELQGRIESLLASERNARTEAEAANRAKDHFLAVLSHELRTPLTPVAMVATAMELDPRVPEDLRDDVAMIRRNVELETRLIDDLLDLSRVMSGKMRVSMQPIDIHQLVGHVMETVGMELHEKGMTVQLHLAAERQWVNGDSARLQQALWNLLKNAAKFTPRGGLISIRTIANGTHIVIEVTDTGRGISGDDLVRIFEPFEQGDAQVTKRYGGMGLGLAIAKAVMDLHGGKISAWSDGEGTGATFTLSLPLCEKTIASAADSGASAAAAEPHPLRVLLVEDHVDTAKTLVRLLRLDGMQVQWASSVAAAAELASSDSFDVIVSDLGLPDGSGCDLMRMLNGEGQPVGIAMSGFGMDDDLRMSREAGFREHLIKPVSLSDLRQAIRRVAATS